ncbi:MAG: hypothetical protein RL616_1950, partial [Verrucomicrobiota bacterium]
MKPNLKQLTISKVLGLAGLLAISATTVQAALWQGGTASYNNTANWDNGLIPSAANTGNAINRSGSNNVVQVNPGDPNWTLGNQDVLLGDVGNSSGAYYQDGPTVTLNFWFRMGLGGGTSAGYATVNSGTLNIGGQLNVSEGGPSVFNNTNTGVVTAGGECWIGNGGGSGPGTGNGSGNGGNGPGYGCYGGGNG